MDEKQAEYVLGWFLGSGWRCLATNQTKMSVIKLNHLDLVKPQRFHVNCVSQENSFGRVQWGGIWDDGQPSYECSQQVELFLVHEDSFVLITYNPSTYGCCLGNN